MNKSNKLLETCDQLAPSADVALMEQLQFYSADVQNTLCTISRILEDAKLPGTHPYTQMLKQLADKSDEILKKVSDFVDKSQARQKEVQATPAKKKEQEATVVESADKIAAMEKELDDMENRLRKLTPSDTRAGYQSLQKECIALSRKIKAMKAAKAKKK